MSEENIRPATMRYLWKGTLEATKVVSGNGWGFKFDPPTYPGAPIQIVAAHMVQTGKEEQENQWENLEDPDELWTSQSNCRGELLRSPALHQIGTERGASKEVPNSPSDQLSDGP